MEVTPTIAFGTVQDVLVFVHRTPLPSDDDWQRFVKYATALPSLGAMLVHADEATLSSAQRGDIRDLYKKFGLQIGLLTDSKLTQGVLTALRWFGIRGMGAPLREVDKVIAFIGRTPLRERLLAELAPFVDSSFRLKRAQ